MLGDFAAELVAEDDLLVGPCKSVIAGADGKLRPLVAPRAGVEIGTSDPATQDLDPNLSATRNRFGPLHHVELGVRADDGSHQRAGELARALTRGVLHGLGPQPPQACPEEPQEQ